MSNQHKNPTISFRITDAERKQIEARILASGMMKKDYFVRSCIYNHICVVGKKETIYPLVQTVNALYLQLLEMQKAFTAPDFTPDNLTTLVKMWLGYFLTKNISDFYLMAFPVWSSLTHHFSA